MTAYMNTKRLSSKQFVQCWKMAGEHHATTRWEVPITEPAEEQMKGFCNVMRAYLGQIDPAFKHYRSEDIERRINRYEQQCREMRDNGRTKEKPPRYPKRRIYSAVRSMEMKTNEVAESFAGFDPLNILKEAAEKANGPVDKNQKKTA